MKPIIDTEQARRADLARIHIAKKDLAMADDTYRALLKTLGGVESSANLDVRGRQRLLAHFAVLGWSGKASKAPSRRPKRPTPSEAGAPMCRKVRAQLISLGKLPDTYADGIAKQMFGVEYFEWLQPDQLHALVAALGKEQARKGVAFIPSRKAGR